MLRAMSEYIHFPHFHRTRTAPLLKVLHAKGVVATREMAIVEDGLIAKAQSVKIDE